MHDLMGTDPENKKLMLFDTDHIVPRIDFIRETLSWLDTYMGPVDRTPQTSDTAALTEAGR